MNLKDLSSLEKAITRLIGELSLVSLWRLKAIYPQATAQTLSALENNILRLQSTLHSSRLPINSILDLIQLMENGLQRTDSSGVISQKDFPPSGGTDDEYIRVAERHTEGLRKSCKEIQENVEKRLGQKLYEEFGSDNKNKTSHT